MSNIFLKHLSERLDMVMDEYKYDTPEEKHSDETLAKYGWDKQGWTHLHPKHPGHEMVNEVERVAHVHNGKLVKSIPPHKVEAYLKEFHKGG